jgi:NADH-quinone oxidoreductase subunit K
VIPLGPFLVVSALLVAIGVFGALTRRSALGILMSIELIINAAAINLVAFSQHIRTSDAESTAGQMFALFAMAMAAAAAAVGLSIVICIHRSCQTVNVDKIDLMKW